MSRLVVRSLGRSKRGSNLEQRYANEEVGLTEVAAGYTRAAVWLLSKATWCIPKWNSPFHIHNV